MKDKPVCVCNSRKQILFTPSEPFVSFFPHCVLAVVADLGGLLLSSSRRSPRTKALIVLLYLAAEEIRRVPNEIEINWCAEQRAEGRRSRASCSPALPQMHID